PYREAIRNLARDPRFPEPLVSKLELLAGFRNVVVHEYVGIDSRRVIEALDGLEPVAELVRIVRALESGVRGE
ncbi:MAG TPA: HepT-like ribonuclease domain-containing protein, partial [Thermoanaerobaculia bacterium]|nr:HepT-like ribonuclease domain-containing protein [Thermoanaerobaculia bacterium]